MPTYTITVVAGSPEQAAAKLKYWTQGKWANASKLFYEQEEPTDWLKEAEMYADYIIYDNWEEWEPSLKEATGDARDRYDKVIYQGADLTSIAHERIDTALCHNSLQQNADLIRDLDEWEETDSGLWDGVWDADGIIEAKAFWTLRAAVVSMAEEKLVAKIEDLIEMEQREDDEEE